MRQTRTFAILEISATAFAEIEERLRAAGYQDQFHDGDAGLVIDMHGLAVHAIPEVSRISSEK